MSTLPSSLPIFLLLLLLLLPLFSARGSEMQELTGSLPPYVSTRAHCHSSAIPPKIAFVVLANTLQAQTVKKMTQTIRSIRNVEDPDRPVRDFTRYFFLIIYFYLDLFFLILISIISS